jgi:tetratricopeptide (TPR) repeat protein
MKLAKFTFLIIVFLSASLSLRAQTSDGDLARFYYEKGEFEKAVLYYEKLYESSQTASNYEGLFNSYLELERLKDAEKLVKKHMKRFRSNLYYIDLGEVYEAAGEEKDADEAYLDAIRALPKSQGMVIRTANEFVRRNKIDYALETYEYGKKLLDNSYPFSYETAGLYGSMGQTERMIEEYLNLLEYNEAYLQTIQNSLNRSIDFQEDNENVEFLRTELLRRVQKNPSNTTYAEMLTWLFLQQQDFNSAYVQLKAIDKRLNENGQRLLNLASLCINNQDFKVAKKCYKYIADKGPENPYYSFAKAGVLKSEFEDQRRSFPLDTIALRKLEKDYDDLLDELGKNRETVGILRQKAQLQAYYLNDLEGATVSLNDALDIPGIHEETRAEMKLQLAKVLIARDYIWDASLLCSQVDKDFKNDILGYQAKFINAQISYYTGDFEWAQAQLDILKGSTSKLISNDAMELSLLITDNMALDTILDPMLMFARADLLTVQNQFDKALATMDSLKTEYPGHSLNDEILLQKAEIAEKRGQIDKAIEYYQQVVAEYYFEITADNALFKMAELYETKLGDEDKAQELYKQIMTDFPGSLYVVEARKRFRRLRGDKPNDELREIPREKVP